MRSASDTATPESATAPPVRAALVVLAPPDVARWRHPRTRRWPVGKLATRLSRAAAPYGGAVHVLRLEDAGDGAGDPAAVDRYLDELHTAHGPVPVALLGAPGRARCTLRAAGHPAVSACAAVGLQLPLDAEQSEPVEQLTGRQVLLVAGYPASGHGPEPALRYAERAHPVPGATCRFEVHGSGRPLYRRAADVRELLCDFALSSVLGRPSCRAVQDAVAAPADAGLRMPLASGFRHHD